MGRDAQRGAGGARILDGTKHVEVKRDGKDLRRQAVGASKTAPSSFQVFRRLAAWREETSSSSFEPMSGQAPQPVWYFTQPRFE